VLSGYFKGTVNRVNPIKAKNNQHLPAKHQFVVFFSGILILMVVPVFKTVTHLPPYLGILAGLGILWIMTEVIHGKKDETVRNSFSVVQALRKIDIPSILFFFGILISVAALQSSGILTELSVWLSKSIGNVNMVVLSMGVLSSVVDNVPLVAATQGMYSLSQFPQDSYFWEFLAYCVGTGGSILIIGSAAGVAAMGMEEINFFWYLKKISLLAFLGYVSGALIYILQNLFPG